MVAICPVVEKKINEKLARINAFFIFLFISVSLLFSIEWLLILIAFDFGMRAYYNERYSLLFHISRFILKAMNASPVFINAGPKIFAARVGLALTIITAILAYTGFYSIAVIVGAILIVFSFLEAAFGFCVACKLYPYLYHLQTKLNQQ